MRPLVLLAIFLVLAVVFSAYAVLYTQGLSTESESTVTVGTYSFRGVYDYVATLMPNQAYNTTTLKYGQGALFTAITKSINVTYTGTVSLSEPGNVNLDTSYLVTLSGGVWNRTLGSSSQATQKVNTVSASYSQSFLVNVTHVVALAKEISNELQYSVPNYLVQITPTATGTLVEAGKTFSVEFVSPLNLTLSGGVIVPSGMMYFHQGNITSVLTVTRGSTYTYRELSYLMLAGSLTLLGLSVFHIMQSRKEEQVDETENIAQMTLPYKEVIAASTTPPPEVGSRVTMEKWDDLVKVADTLGKPILEYSVVEDGSPHHLFWVLDGETTYVYETKHRTST